MFLKSLKCLVFGMLFGFCLGYSNTETGLNHKKENGYVLLYESNILNTTNDNSSIYGSNLGFSNGMNDFNIFKKHFDIDREECFRKCKNNIKCLGVFEYSTENNTNICNLLPSIDKPKFYNKKTKSWLKINEKNYEDKNYYIYGTIYDSYDVDEERHYGNTTVYIDLNHNGLLDKNEPSTTANGDGYFKLDNLSEGTYLVRQDIPEGCYQLYPGLYGNYLDYINHGNGYIDNVVYFYWYSHHSKARPHGGSLSSQKSVANIDYTYILGDNHDYYFSFYPENIIVFSFVDETIIDTPGDDIFVETRGIYTTTRARVYVSHNNIDYYFLGVVGQNTTSFDLSNSNEKNPVSYIKLVFFCTEDYNHETMYNSLDIVSISGEINSLYQPSYSYYSKLSSNQKNDYVLFFNDCHYLADCDLYCLFNMYDINDINSCDYGCKLFEKTNNCYCSLDENSRLSYNYSDFNYRSCNSGCHQAMRMFVSPNYTLITDAIGYESNEESIFDNCSSNCLTNLIDSCDAINECTSFSLYNNLFDKVFHGHTYNEPYFKKDNNYNLFVNNKFLKLSSESTTSTTSITSTTTSSGTSTTSTGTSTTSSGTSTTSSGTSTTSSGTSIIILKKNKSNNRSNKKYVYYLVPILCIIVASISIYMIYNCIKHKNRNVIIDDNRNSFNNPMYDQNKINNDFTEEQNEQEEYNTNGLYSDVSGDNPEGLYNDVTTNNNDLYYNTYDSKNYSFSTRYDYDREYNTDDRDNGYLEIDE